VALAGEGASEPKSGFAEMLDIDGIQKRVDLLDDRIQVFLSYVAAVQKAAPNTPHMLIFVSIATPQ
jgi:hypothetical protein